MSGVKRSKAMRMQAAAAGQSPRSRKGHNKAPKVPRTTRRKGASLRRIQALKY